MNAPTIAVAVTPAAYHDVEIKSIAVSTTLMQVHRRAALNKDAMKLLTENVRLVGVLQPILLRPMPKGYELVAGERRFLAASAAGLKTIPAMVRPLTDLQALELQVIENKQREDLHPLIESEGFEELMKKHNYTAEQIAEKVGMSRRHVFNRLVLLNLCPEVRTQFLADKVNLSIAQLLARIPVQDLQRKACDEITKPAHGGESLTVRRAAEHLHQHYMLRLDQAPFKTDDATLYPNAGTCGLCPKRTGNQKELFADVKSADICTDPQCFGQKKAFHQQRLVKEAEERGQKVITGAEAKKLKPERWSDVGGGYLEVDRETYIGGKFQSVRKILGKKMPDTVLLQDPSDPNKLVEIVQRTAIATAMTAKGIRLDSNRPSNGGSNGADAEYRKNARRAQMLTAMRAEIFAAIHARPLKLGSDELTMITQAFWQNLDFAEQKERLEKLWQRKEFSGDAWIEKLDDGQLARLLLDMALIGEVKVGHHNVRSSQCANLLAVAKKVGADAAGITKKHQAAFDAREKERTDKKRKATANAKKKAEAAAPKAEKATPAKKAKKS